MIRFVNAKINIGLQIVGKRPDGYHELRTIFYPVGLYSGTPENPDSFCDILEVKAAERHSAEQRFTLDLLGRPCRCEKKDNLVWRAADLYMKEVAGEDFSPSITLYKNIPDGAGMGGGSADAAFTLRALRDLEGSSVSDEYLERLALRLGADCPFFIRNTPSYAEGIGELLTPVELRLRGWWMVAVKPMLHISTATAFAGVVPREPLFDLRLLGHYYPGEWNRLAVNDFEDSLFPWYPELRILKLELLQYGAKYSSLTGSGAVVYGLFSTREAAVAALPHFQSQPTNEGVYLLEL